MEKQIAEGQIGSVGKYDFEFKDGKLVAEVGAQKGPLEASLVVKLDAIDVAMASIDWICQKVPGPLDDAAGALIKAELLKLKAAQA